MLYSYLGSYPTTIPERIRLSDGQTRTDSATFTEAELNDAGWTIVSDKPAVNEVYQGVEWDGTDWVILDRPQADVEKTINQKWAEIRARRNKLLSDSDWTQLMDSPFQGARVYQEEVLQYRQGLRDITNQTDPFNIVWPVNPIPTTGI